MNVWFPFQFCSLFCICFISYLSLTCTVVIGQDMLYILTGTLVMLFQVTSADQTEAQLLWFYIDTHEELTIIRMMS